MFITSASKKAIDYLRFGDYVTAKRIILDGCENSAFDLLSMRLEEVQLALIDPATGVGLHKTNKKFQEMFNLIIVEK